MRDALDWQVRMLTLISRSPRAASQEEVKEGSHT